MVSLIIFYLLLVSDCIERCLTTQDRLSHVIFDIPMPITCQVPFRGSPDDDDELIGIKLSSHVRDLP